MCFPEFKVVVAKVPKYQNFQLPKSQAAFWFQSLLPLVLDDSNLVVITTLNDLTMSIDQLMPPILGCPPNIFHISLFQVISI